MFKKINKNFFFILFILFVLHYLNFFLNIFIVYKNNYTERMIKSSGFCDGEGYGFIKNMLQKHKILENIEVINFSVIYPQIYGYFYDIKKKFDPKYIILINAQNKNLENFKNQRFSVIDNQNNSCYLLKKL
jgi:hypothetical protein